MQPPPRPMLTRKLCSTTALRYQVKTMFQGPAQGPHAASAGATGHPQCMVTPAMRTLIILTAILLVALQAQAGPLQARADEAAAAKEEISVDNNEVQGRTWPAIAEYHHASQENVALEPASTGEACGILLLSLQKKEK
ncbi:Neutrophil defensin 1 [Plecturocebus cupreus]